MRIGERNTPARFWAQTIPEPNSGCLLWLGHTMKSGYPVFQMDGKKWGGNRLAYMLTYGVIPIGLHILHKCDTPNCVNPDHLYAGTPLDNQRDMRIRRRNTNTNKTHCPRGHAYAGTNVKVNGRGSRVCGTCCKDRDATRVWS